MIARQTALGGILMVGARLITRVMDLATMLVLARFLLPTDFGLVAIATSVVTVVEAALELPLNQALVRLPTISRSQFDTVFTLSALRALALGCVLMLGAWPFARFYGDARLLPLVLVLTVGAIARGLTSPRLAEFQKTMSFWRDFVVELVGKAMGLTVGVTTAVVTGGYWSIAAGAVAYPLTVVVCSYCFAPYRPRLSLADLPLFSGFVGWMSAAQVISALNWQSERLLLGKLQTTARLGLFTTASDMAQIPFLALFGPITRPLLAAFSLLEGDKVRLRRSYRTVSRAIMAVGLPLVIGESLLAEPAVRLVLGEKWLAAAPLLRWLCLSVVPGLFALPAVPLVMSFGQTRMFLKRNLLEFSVKIPLVLIGGTWFGIVGIVIARVLSEAVAALYCTMVVRGMIGLSIREQLLGSWRYFVGTLVMAPPVIMCARHLGQIEGVVPSAAGLLMTVVLGASVYSAALWALWLFSGRPEGIEAMAIRTLSNMINKTRKHA